MQPILKRSQVRVEERPRRAPAHDGADPASHEKRARLVSVGGEVRAIEFRCDCGETSLIELEFAASDASSATLRETES